MSWHLSSFSEILMISRTRRHTTTHRRTTLSPRRSTSLFLFSGPLLMKRVRIQRWGSQFLASRASPRLSCPCQTLFHHPSFPQQTHNRRPQSTQATRLPPLSDFLEPSQSEPTPSIPPEPESLPSPPPSAALSSAKLAALHARLSLPPRFPLQTLARTLIHQSADPNPAFNNSSLSQLGTNLLGYYTAEHLMCHYPRLPMSVLFAAQAAYVGPQALAQICKEWGVESVAEPGGEVDPGLLQFRSIPAGASLPSTSQGAKTGRPNAERSHWNTSTTSKIIYDDQFGSPQPPPTPSTSSPNRHELQPPVPLETASASFIRALIGATYLHCGAPTTHRFYTSHFLSRHLSLPSLFDFRIPTRDLSRLCAREGFEPPVARLESETGRKSRHPVFVVGVYSGADKLGEGTGASLNEARVRASAAALKSWYLYRPLEVCVPSAVEVGMGQGGGKGKWRPNLVDLGEVIT